MKKIEVSATRMVGIAPSKAKTNTMSWSDERMSEPSKLLKYNVHSHLQGLPTDKIQKIAEATALPVALMTYNLTGDINVGMAVRSACILGCSDVYVVGKRHYDRRTEVGARNYIHIHRLGEVEPGFFKANKLLPILLEQGGTPLEEFRFRSYLPDKLAPGWKVCFVAGCEAHGLPASLMKELGAPILTISQYGVMRSLNVSVACSILLYEYMKQWRRSCVL